MCNVKEACHGNERSRDKMWSLPLGAVNELTCESCCCNKHRCCEAIRLWKDLSDRLNGRLKCIMMLFLSFLIQTKAHVRCVRALYTIFHFWIKAHAYAKNFTPHPHQTRCPEHGTSLTNRLLLFQLHGTRCDQNARPLSSLYVTSFIVTFTLLNTYQVMQKPWTLCAEP